MRSIILFGLIVFTLADTASGQHFDPSMPGVVTTQQACDDLDRAWAARLEYLRQQRDACGEREHRRSSQCPTTVQQFERCFYKIVRRGVPGPCGSTYFACDSIYEQHCAAQRNRQAASALCQTKLQAHQRQEQWKKDQQERDAQAARRREQLRQDDRQKREATQKFLDRQAETSTEMADTWTESQNQNADKRRRVDADAATGTEGFDVEALRPRYVPTGSSDGNSTSPRTSLPAKSGEGAPSLPDFESLLGGKSSSAATSSKSDSGTPTFDDLLARASKNPGAVVSAVTGDLAPRAAPFASIPFAMLDNVFVAQARLVDHAVGQIEDFESSSQSSDFVREFGNEAFSPSKFLKVILDHSAGEATARAANLALSAYSRGVAERWRKSDVGKARHPWWVVGSGVVFAPEADAPGLAGWWVSQLSH